MNWRLAFAAGLDGGHLGRWLPAVCHRRCLTVILRSKAFSIPLNHRRIYRFMLHFFRSFTDDHASTYKKYKAMNSGIGGGLTNNQIDFSPYRHHILNLPWDTIIHIITIQKNMYSTIPIKSPLLINLLLYFIRIPSTI